MRWSLIFLLVLSCTTRREQEWKWAGSSFTCSSKIFKGNQDIIIKLPKVPKCNKNLNVYSSYYNKEVTPEECRREILRYSYDLKRWEACRTESILETYYDIREHVVENTHLSNNLRRVYQKKPIPLRIKRIRWRDRTFAGRTECASMPNSQCQFQLADVPRCVSFEHATFEERRCIFQVKEWMFKLQEWRDRSLRETHRFARYRYNSEVERILNYKGVRDKEAFRERAKLIFAYPRRK